MLRLYLSALAFDLSKLLLCTLEFSNSSMIRSRGFEFKHVFVYWRTVEFNNSLIADGISVYRTCCAVGNIIQCTYFCTLQVVAASSTIYAYVDWRTVEFNNSLRADGTFCL